MRFLLYLGGVALSWYIVDWSLPLHTAIRKGNELLKKVWGKLAKPWVGYTYNWKYEGEV